MSEHPDSSDLIDVEITKKIKTKEDFILFLNILIKDHELNHPWENRDVGTYLYGVSYFAMNADGFYYNQNMEFSETPDWQMFANLLAAARVY
jgi:hypothetical protein